MPRRNSGVAQLLKVVTEQDIEEDEKGIRIREGVARDRVLSIVDPEMRHGGKARPRKWTGTK